MSHQLIEKNLSETASLSEQQEFERWPNASDKNLKYFNKTKVIWNSLDEAFLTKKFNKDSAQISDSFETIQANFICSYIYTPN
jgi:ferric-dicitrate binding protein FerR (iron transport regulator)